MVGGASRDVTTEEELVRMVPHLTKAPESFQQHRRPYPLRETLRAHPDAPKML
jgi:hypothetical protein